MNTVVEGKGLYMAKLGEPAPISKMEITGEKDGMEWRIVGHVANLHIDREPEFEDILSDWSMDALHFKSAEKITLSAQFVGDPEQLKIFWGGGGPSPQVTHHVETGVDALRRLLHG